MAQPADARTGDKTQLSKPTRDKSSFRLRIVKFVFFNMILAVLPVAFVAFLRATSGADQPLRNYMPDLLFLSVVVTAAALGDLTDTLLRGGASESLLYYMFGLLFGLIVATGFFGVFRYADILGSLTEASRDNLTPIAIGLVIALCIASVVFEVILAGIHTTTAPTVSQQGAEQ
jgi:hypothetical protein